MSEFNAGVHRSMAVFRKAYLTNSLFRAPARLK